MNKTEILNMLLTRVGTELGMKLEPSFRLKIARYMAIELDKFENVMREREECEKKLQALQECCNHLCVSWVNKTDQTNQTQGICVACLSTVCK